MSQSESVLIVGAGVIGLNCAYFLERAGYAVTVIDQGEVGGGCSHANCGYICPSHVLPLTKPGTVRMALKSLFNPDAPFRVHPRFDPALWRWLQQFARRCNHDHMIAAGHALKAILDSSMEAYRHMLATEPLDFEWKESGLLYAFATGAALEEFAKNDRLLREQFGVGARRMSGEELRTFDPALKPGLAGGFLFEMDAAVRADKLNAALHRLLVERGVVFHEQCRLTGLRKEAGRLVTVQTSTGTLEADHYVLAAGAWSAKWAKAFECPLPIQPGKGYSVTMQRPAGSPHCATLFPETRVGITPMEGRIRFGSLMEFGGYDTSIRPERLRLLYAGANRYLVQPIEEPVIEEWYGWRPMTWDSLPVIGPAPRLGNVTFATGHNMIGMSLGAGTGRLVAELISGVPPHLDPKPYAPGRFG